MIKMILRLTIMTSSSDIEDGINESNNANNSNDDVS